MYLYAERQNGRKLGGQRVPAGDMNPATTRALLEKHFPGARVLSPLEPKQDGSIEVITVYGTRSADGRNRCTGIEQWGIQGHTAIYKCSICGEAHPTAYHNHPAAFQEDGPTTAERLPQDEIRHMAEHVRRWTFKYLIETTTICRPEAMHMAVDAANRYAEELGVEFCRCGTPLPNGVESNICRTCGNPIDRLLTEKRTPEHAHTCHACGKVIGISHDCERNTDHDFGLCRRCTEHATREGV